jgi:hypothetical protein
MFHLSKKCVLSGLGVVALSIGVVGSASALSAGSITNANNDGVTPIYGTNTRDGYYGANWYLVGGSADIKIELLGYEAGAINKFYFGDTLLFTGGNGVGGADGTWIPDAGLPSSTTINGVATGLLNFKFTTSLGGEAVNGANPDDAAGESDINFFSSIDECATCTFGQSLTLWFDDSGASDDDNHDDLAIRLSIVGGDGGFAVPVPAAAWLFGSALFGLVGVARRQRG